MTVWAAGIINPGLETGDNTGWTSDLNASPAAGIGGRTGVHFFRLSSSDVDAAYFQDINIPSAIKGFAAKGALTFNPSVYQTDFAGDADSQRFRVQVLDNAGDIIQTWMQSDGAFVGNIDGTWVAASVQLPLHKSANAIRLYTEGLRVGGTELSAYQDDYALVANSSGLFRYEIGFANLNAADGVTGWTVTSGSLNTKSSNGSGVNLVAPTSLHFYGAATAAFRAHQTVTLPISYGLDTALDTGALNMVVHYLQGSFNTLDQGAIGIRCLDTSDVELSSVGLTNSACSNFYITRSFGAVIPTLTRKITMVLHGVRVSGSNLDCNFGAIEAYLTVDSNFLDGDNAITWPVPGASLNRTFPDTRGRFFPLLNANRAFPVQ